MSPRTVAIMQPYVFPYIGYFQLIRAVDHFVFYDDVQFIKRGWINRNRISNRGQDALFTVPVSGGSQQVRICDVICNADDKWVRRFATQIKHEYGKAPHFAAVNALVADVLDGAQGMPVSELAIRSVERVLAYLGESAQTSRASLTFPRDETLRRGDRLIDITARLGGERYVNLPGGMELYGPEPFAARGIELAFIVEKSRPYRQFAHAFLPRLSIIDVLMHNDPATVREMLGEYELIDSDRRPLAPRR